MHTISSKRFVTKFEISQNFFKLRLIDECVKPSVKIGVRLSKRWFKYLTKKKKYVS